MCIATKLTVFNFIYCIVGIAEFCNPSYMYMYYRRFGYSASVHITAPSGIFSYGIGNVGRSITVFLSVQIFLTKYLTILLVVLTMVN